MDRLTFDGNFCDIAQCEATPGGSYCESGVCSQRKVWERLKEYEDTGLMPDDGDEILVLTKWGVDTDICCEDEYGSSLEGRVS